MNCQDSVCFGRQKQRYGTGVILRARSFEGVRRRQNANLVLLASSLRINRRMYKTSQVQVTKVQVTLEDAGVETVLCFTAFS